IISVGICYMKMHYLDSKDELREGSKKLIHVMGFVNHVPWNVTILKRFDEYNIVEDGCLYKSSIELEKNINSNADVNSVKLPFFCEHKKGKRTATVKNGIIVKKVLINGKEYPNNVYTQEGVYTKLDSYRKIERGYVTVPLEIKESTQTCEIIIEVFLKEIFSELNTQEFVLVEIPYIIRQMNVKITSNIGSKKIIPFNGSHHFFEVYNTGVSFSDIDTIEVSKQKAEMSVGTTDQSIEFNILEPKLGYSYKFFFKRI
ncbi:MAG: hypothetical protein ABF289_16990, partial [Clostridiales bacterium]